MINSAKHKRKTRKSKYVFVGDDAVAVPSLLHSYKLKTSRLFSIYGLCVWPTKISILVDLSHMIRHRANKIPSNQDTWTRQLKEPGFGRFVLKCANLEKKLGMIGVVTREQHLFFEEKGYLIITDALNQKEIENHKFWAEFVPVYYQDRAGWKGGRLSNSSGKHISNSAHFFWGGSGNVVSTTVF
ncbi:hypothetical protein BHYA_0024g00320 [Botrytis hyacinthi]|uniref:Uncharacterized protein n=1 Tax=Botrytis hyacinthi TaxID=278943 RepID=A0A4Z1GWC5_9HELO|nr:hypothetical protein BHYA_0024g00320 [Botrytis hyacinthi]